MPPAIKPSLSLALTLIISAFLLAEGIWGLFNPVIFGVLTTNRAHAIVHIVLGLGGFIARWRGFTKGYFGFLGSLLLVVAVVWLVPATREVPRDLLNMNGAVAAVNFLVGLIALLIAFTEAGRRRFGTGNTVPPMSVSKTRRKTA
jgi:hypothetical protein